MPRKAIDYSNTIIYKLCCNDPTITDIYVGHTTNWTNRKRHHKCRCNNEKDKNHNIYVYQFIREHGGWTNWSMIEIEKISCVDTHEALKNERKYFDLLGATLNIDTPSRTKHEYYIDTKEHIIEYRKEHKEHIKEIHKKYCEENKEHIKELNKKYYEENKEKNKERNKKYREENKEKIHEYNKKYYENKKNKIS